MLDLDHLTVSGDVNFGKGVSLRVSVASMYTLLEYLVVYVKG